MLNEKFLSSSVKNTSIILFLTIVAAGCGGSSSGPAATLPGVTISSASIHEGNSGTKNIDLTITLDQAANGTATVDYNTTDGTATTADNDYTSTSGTLTINASSLSGVISVPINGEKIYEGDETFTITLSNASANVAISGSASVVVTILDDDHLSDTGVTTCSDGTSNGLTCPQAGFPAQDAEVGLDVTNNDPADGSAGFSYTQIDANGDALATKSIDFATTPWSCVLDNNTGLTWEVKTTTSDLQHQNWTYTWFNSTGINDAGVPGTADTGAANGNDNCFDAARCDTEKYVADINAMSLCGYTDWRLPAIDELAAIVDLSIATGVAIDAGYFLNATDNNHQSSTPAASNTANNFMIQFSPSNITSTLKSTAFRIMLVRGL